MTRLRDIALGLRQAFCRHAYGEFVKHPPLLYCTKCRRFAGNPKWAALYIEVGRAVAAGRPVPRKALRR